MKKFVTLLMTGLLMVMCQANVFAATYIDAGYLDVGYVTGRGSKETYTVVIGTNGKATDGVTEIAYNSDELSIEESDIVLSDDVDLYSVNVTDGVVKIGYLSEKPIARGRLMVLTFNVNETYLNKDVSVTVKCSAFDANGVALKTGENLVIEEPDTEDSSNQESTENQGQTGSTESTGSSNQGTTSSETSSEATSSEASSETTDSEASSEATETTEAVDATEATTETVEKTPVEVKVDPTSEEAWKEVAEKLETITEEEELVVAFKEAVEAIVSVDFLEAVKEQAATVVLDLGNGISWVIDGSTITEATEVNFDVTIDAGDIPEEKVKEVAPDKESVKISLAHDGDFGCEPEMKFPAGKEYHGKYANLYYYNPETGELEFICAELVEEDGFVKLKFKHASDYIVVYDDVNQMESTAPVAPSTPVEQPEASSNMGMVIGIVALLAVVIVAVVVVMKKKAK